MPSTEEHNEYAVPAVVIPKIRAQACVCPPYKKR